MKIVKPEECLFILGMEGQKFEFDSSGITPPELYKYEMDGADHQRDEEGNRVMRNLPHRFIVNVQEQEITLEDLRIRFQDLEQQYGIVFYKSITEKQGKYMNTPPIIDDISPFTLRDTHQIFRNIERMMQEVYDIKR